MEWRHMEEMGVDNQRIRDETEILKSKYEALRKFALQQKIPLPPELETLWKVWIIFEQELDLRFYLL